MKKFFYVALAIALVVVGIYLYFSIFFQVAPTEDVAQNSTSKTQSQNTNSNTLTQGASAGLEQTQTPKPAETKKDEGGFELPKKDAPVSQEPTEPGPDGGDLQVHEVDFSGTAFTPSTLTVAVGDYVFFKNSSKVDVWPASDPHPTHTGLTGFDAKKSIKPGENFKYQFSKKGTYGYHSHVDPNIKGTIIVK